MRNLVLILLVCPSLHWPLGHTAEVVDPGSQNQPSPITFDPAARPSLNSVDEYFKKLGRNASEECTTDWQRFRKLPVTVQAVKMPYEELLAKAVAVGISPTKFKRTYDTFIANQSQLPNQKYISIIDFDKDPSEKRLFVISLETGEIERAPVANGKGSGKLGAIPTKFSNMPGTNASSLGCVVATFDQDEKGKQLTKGSGEPKLMIHGIEPTNDNTCERSIFMHSEAYSSPEGRSKGCQAIPGECVPTIFNKLRHGGLMCTLREGPYTEAAVAPEQAPKKRKKKHRSKKRRKK